MVKKLTNMKIAVSLLESAPLTIRTIFLYLLIGNKHLLRCCEVWSKILDHYDREKKLVVATDFINSVGI